MASQGRRPSGEMLPRLGLAASRDRRGESSGLPRPGLFPTGKKAALDESPSDDRLPNRQINKPKKSVHVDFLPRKKAGKPVGFWATKLALNNLSSLVMKFPRILLAMGSTVASHSFEGLGLF